MKPFSCSTGDAGRLRCHAVRGDRLPNVFQASRPAMPGPVLAAAAHRRRQLVAYMAAAGLMLLAGCQTQQAGDVAVTAKMPHAPFNLGVASIDIIDEYTPPGLPPNIEHELVKPVSVRITEWAERLLRPADSQGNLLVSITQAELLEQDIASSETLKSLFTNEQRLLITCQLGAIFTFSHPQGNRSATIEVSARHEATVGDTATPAEADAVRLRVMEQAISHFDAEFRRQITGLQSADGWPQG